ncbi:MAG: APC family permease [Verrucomicrobia bacterium]|nr:APC family permease [Verrucomicrobiota bacterium]
MNVPSTETPHLRRVLTAKDLIFYGIVLIQPISPVGIFGLASRMSEGHAATAILIAMVAMSLTAASYGRMATLYPSAGSAYTYVGRAFNPHLGFLAGWAMFLDYLIIPLINVVYGALTMQRVVPGVPFLVWAGAIALIITWLNLRGVRSTARANELLLYVMCAVIGAFVFMAARHLLLHGGWGALFSIEPFYNARTFQWSTALTATSFAALTYIGFDGVTTLAEEVKEPRRTVPWATVMVCVITGAFSTVEIYLAQRVWPDSSTFLKPETAFMDVTQMVGGEWLFQAMGATVVVACIGSGLSGLAGAARLLYSMGRDNVLPRRLFGRLDAKRGIPAFNIAFLGVLSFFGAWLISYARAAEVLNFGAFLGFLGVNAAAFWEYGIRRRDGHARRWLMDFVVPGLGFAFCLVIWLNLARPAQIAGCAWLLAGIVYLALLTRGFRVEPVALDFSEDAPGNEKEPPRS